jgi:hypothetical protein
VASKATANKVIDSWEKAAAYAKMDGKTSTYKIAETVGVPQRTVATWADDLVKASLASPPDEFHSSHKAMFSLGELSIDLAQLKKRKASRATPTAEPEPTLDAKNQSPMEGTGSV